MMCIRVRYVCVCVWMFVCMHVCVCMRVPCVCVCMRVPCVCVCVCMHVCVCVCVCVFSQQHCSLWTDTTTLCLNFFFLNKASTPQYVSYYFVIV